MNLKIKNALVSVSDKENIVPLLKILKKYKIKIISSGGTYNTIRKLGFESTELSKYTGFKEMLDGRVKTLHPKIHAGTTLSHHKNESIDLIVVILHFQKLLQIFLKNKKNIDIGDQLLQLKTLKM